MNTRVRILNKVQYLDAYWTKISKTVKKLQAKHVEFKNITKNLLWEERKKILTEIVVENLKLHVKKYILWEKELLTKSRKA